MVDLHYIFWHSSYIIFGVNVSLQIWQYFLHLSVYNKYWKYLLFWLHVHLPFSNPFLAAPAFLLPLPSWVVDSLTQPLLRVSATALFPFFTQLFSSRTLATARAPCHQLAKERESARPGFEPSTLGAVRGDENRYSMTPLFQGIKVKMKKILKFVKEKLEKKIPLAGALGQAANTNCMKGKHWQIYPKNCL